jgi:hypothetical protein
MRPIVLAALNESAISMKTKTSQKRIRDARSFAV